MVAVWAIWTTSRLLLSRFGRPPEKAAYLLPSELTSLSLSRSCAVRLRPRPVFQCALVEASFDLFFVHRVRYPKGALEAAIATLRDMVILFLLLVLEFFKAVSVTMIAGTPASQNEA